MPVFNAGKKIPVWQGKRMFHELVATVHGNAVFSRRVRILSELVQALVPENARVLDVGTGDGTIAGLLQQARPDLLVEGIDVLVRPETHIPVRRFDGRTIPYTDKSMDVVTFIDVLHHTYEALPLLREAARVATRFVIIKDHLAENWFDHATLRFMDWVGNAPHGVDLPYHYFSFDVWTQQFRDAGLTRFFFANRLRLYPFPANLIFGRGLHFVAKLSPPGAGPKNLHRTIS
jgi:SAM-dependent methyltransferase